MKLPTTRIGESTPVSLYIPFLTRHALQPRLRSHRVNSHQKPLDTFRHFNKRVHKGLHITFMSLLVKWVSASPPHKVHHHHLLNRGRMRRRRATRGSNLRQLVLLAATTIAILFTPCNSFTTSHLAQNIGLCSKDWGVAGAPLPAFPTTSSLSRLRECRGTASTGGKLCRKGVEELLMGSTRAEGDVEEFKSQLTSGINRMEERGIHPSSLLPEARNRLSRLAKMVSRAPSPVKATGIGGWSSPLVGTWRLVLTDEPSWLRLLLPSAHDVYVVVKDDDLDDAGTMQLEYGATMKNSPVLLNSMRLVASCKVVKSGNQVDVDAVPARGGNPQRKKHRESLVYTVRALVVVIAGAEIRLPVWGSNQEGEIGIDYFDAEMWFESFGGGVTVYRHVSDEAAVESSSLWGISTKKGIASAQRSAPQSLMALNASRLADALRVAWRLAALASISIAATLVVWPLAATCVAVSDLAASIFNDSPSISIALACTVLYCIASVAWRLASTFTPAWAALLSLLWPVATATQIAARLVAIVSRRLGGGDDESWYTSGGKYAS